MKTLLLLWALPITILGAWYGLSYYDMSFGVFMLTRDAHDLVFQIYGNILGIPPEILPRLFEPFFVASLSPLCIPSSHPSCVLSLFWLP